MTTTEITALKLVFILFASLYWCFCMGLPAMWTWWSNYGRHQRMRQNQGVRITVKTTSRHTSRTISHQNRHLKVVLLPVHGHPSHQVCHDCACSIWKFIFVSIIECHQNESGKVLSKVEYTRWTQLCYVSACNERIMYQLLL